MSDIQIGRILREAKVLSYGKVFDETRQLLPGYVSASKGKAAEGDTLSGIMTLPLTPNYLSAHRGVASFRLAKSTAS